MGSSFNFVVFFQGLHLVNFDAVEARLSLNRIPWLDGGGPEDGKHQRADHVDDDEDPKNVLPLLEGVLFVGELGHHVGGHPSPDRGEGVRHAHDGPGEIGRDVKAVG